MWFFEIVWELRDARWLPFHISWGDAITAIGTLAAVWAALKIAGDSSREERARQAESRQKGDADRKHMAEAMSVALYSEIMRLNIVTRQMIEAEGPDLRFYAPMLETHVLDQLASYLSIFEHPLAGDIAQVMSHTHGMKVLLRPEAGSASRLRVLNSSLRQQVITLDRLRPMSVAAGRTYAAQATWAQSDPTAADPAPS